MLILTYFKLKRILAFRGLFVNIFVPSNWNSEGMAQNKKPTLKLVLEIPNATAPNMQV